MGFRLGCGGVDQRIVQGSLFFERAEKVVHSLDKLMVPGEHVPTLGEAQIAVFGFRVAGQFRQMLALRGSISAMLDGRA
jgi:hypothetical protein